MRFALRGFTLLEIVLTMAIIGILATVGTAVTMTMYRSAILKSERTLLVNLFQKARTQAMANLNGANHGLKITGNSYVVFEGPNYDNRVQGRDETVGRDATITIAGPTEIVFIEISGNAQPNGDIIVNSGNGSFTISVNDQGRIDY
jgi:prepilin-type N-terminal cleavage/methylation domain-containing protein